MRSLGRSTLVAAVVALVATAAVVAAGPTTVSTTYAVDPLTVPGVSTGFVVRSGETITVAGSGTVCPFGAFGPCYGPGGNPAFDTTSSGFGGFVLPGAPAWGLVGRVGGGPWVQIGTGPAALSGSGVLQFAVNDDLFADNSGSFTVTVTYSCWPGWGYGDKNHRHCGPPGLAGNERTASKPKETASKPKETPPAQEHGRSAEAHEDHGREEGKPRGKSGK